MTAGSRLRATETSFIVAVQRTRLAAALVPAGRALSFFGEHAAGWILLGLLGAGIDWPHAGAWLLSVLAVVVAHGLSIVIKRVVRRPRPGAGAPSAVRVFATAPSKLSFPSSHASSTMAACIVYTAFVPQLWWLAVIVALAMGASRVLLGMHFVTDVLAGYLIGLVVGVPTILLLHG
ncbi:phosphatase PAP2 family protein [Subtercola sp. YIM 133946]|uniref:phosphatase PAP2 family protein n=1 Tax=Subtercola sp. YIM 133946 TaxID=3118909 RepID=UPI002F926F86